MNNVYAVIQDLGHDLGRSLVGVLDSLGAAKAKAAALSVPDVTVTVEEADLDGSFPWPVVVYHGGVEVWSRP